MRRKRSPDKPLPPSDPAEKSKKSLLHAHPLSFDGCSTQVLQRYFEAIVTDMKQRNYTYSMVGYRSVNQQEASESCHRGRNWRINMLSSRSKKSRYGRPTGASDQHCVPPGRDGPVGCISGCAEIRGNRRIHSRRYCSSATGSVCKGHVSPDAMLAPMLLILARFRMTFTDYPNVKKYCEMIRASTDLACSSLSCVCSGVSICDEDLSPTLGWRRTCILVHGFSVVLDILSSI